MKIGLLFGSFNPVHTGHLLVATLMRESAGLEEVWLVVSPLNPFKVNTELADENQRLEMVRLALIGSEHLKVSDIEFSLPKPSYTHYTLKELCDQYPEDTFSLIIGEDNAASFGDWKEAAWIKANFEILVYNRDHANAKDLSLNDPAFKRYQLPAFDISSTDIRNRIKNNKSIRYFLPETVEQFIRFHKLYT